MIKKMLPLFIAITFLLSVAQIQTASAGLLSFSISDEERLGKEYHQELSKEYKVTPDERITRIGNRIAQVSGMEGKVQFFLIDLGKEDKPNAFQTPGYIYVTKSLASLLNDDELTYVVGHEMGHQVKHHIRRAIQRAQKTQFWTLLFGTVVRVPTSILSLGATGIVNKYSRKQELEADRYGYLVTKQLGIDVESAVEAFKKIMTEKAPPKLLQDIFGTHPLLNQRTQRLEEAAKVEEQPPMVLIYPAGAVVLPPEVLAKVDRATIASLFDSRMGMKGTSIETKDYYLRVEMLQEDYSENLVKNLTAAWKVPVLWYVRSVETNKGAVKVETNVFVPGKGRAVITKDAKPASSTSPDMGDITAGIVSEQVTANDMSRYSFKGISPY